MGCKKVKLPGNAISEEKSLCSMLVSGAGDGRGSQPQATGPRPGGRPRYRPQAEPCGCSLGSPCQGLLRVGPSVSEGGGHGGSRLRNRCGRGLGPGGRGEALNQPQRRFGAPHPQRGERPSLR